MGKGGADRPLANSGASLHTQSAARPVQGSLGPASRRRPVVCRLRHLDPGSPLSSALLFIASLDAWESLPARSWGRLRTLSATRGKLGDRDERRRFHAPVRLRLAKIIEEKEYPEWLLPRGNLPSMWNWNKAMSKPAGWFQLETVLWRTKQNQSRKILRD